MNQDTLEKLKAAAPSIEKFRHLHPDEQKWLIDLISTTIALRAGVVTDIGTLRLLLYQD